MVKNILIALSFSLLISCNLGMNQLLGRTTSDPFTEIPKVKSFNGDFSIIINWTEDEAADMYYLYRASNANTPYYQLIYKGNNTEYTDIFTLPNEGEMYLYRLGKLRGQKLFVDLNTRGMAGIGVVSPSIRDLHEPNDRLEDATPLNINVLYSNSWLFASNNLDGLSIYDDDWYYIDLAPHWVATIIITDLDTIPMGVENHFKIETWGVGSSNIPSAKPIDIVNPTEHYNRMYFRIYPDFSSFQSIYYHDDERFGSYGTFVRYTIKISNTSPG